MIFARRLVVTRQVIEKYQVFIYLAAIGGGLCAGAWTPEHMAKGKGLLWPVLALLLYSTFTQVPLAHLREAVADGRFTLAAVLGNFLLVPAAVWVLIHFLPSDPAVRLGVLLVLLVPCTDWFITFSHLGGGDTRHAIAFSPVSLLLQIVLLPLYLWLFLGKESVVAMASGDMVTAFAGLILLPLLAAYLTERWSDRTPARLAVREALAWLPVPLLALVVFLIAATQVQLVTASLPVLGHLGLVYTVYLALAALMARMLTRLFRLPSRQGRVLAFSLGTRNSFVVLPLALALPTPNALAVVAIVFQSLVELIGMAAYLWLVPRWFSADQNHPR
ncbi:MAG: hypothetical protein N2111_08890 [Candidatus Sumerlaeaceae bacterium]|nr:hypothetical protein [Candidatus Sumerlaeaceae bacterium]